MDVRFIVAVVGAALAPLAFSQENYRVDPLHTVTTFSVSHLGLSLQRGSFGRTTGMVVLDRAARMGSIDVAIDAASVTSGSPSREAMVTAPSRAAPAAADIATTSSSKPRPGSCTARGAARFDGSRA